MYSLPSERALFALTPSLPCGLSLADVRGSPFVLVNTQDDRVRSWNVEWFSYGIMTLTKLPPEDISTFSALAMYITVWQGAWRGASYFSVSDMFDFFDDGTKEWLRAVISTAGFSTVMCHDGEAIRKWQASYLDESMLRYFESCLHAGVLAATTLLEEQRGACLGQRGVDAALFRARFSAVKCDVLRFWPEDPYKAFSMG